MAKTVTILGGGISGLSTAFYLLKRFNPGGNIKITLLEKSSQCGGCVRTVTRTDGSSSGGGHYFELGPRGVRPVGEAGMNTLDLIEELGIGGLLSYVKKGDASAKNRMIYFKDRLIKLPTDMSVLWKKVEPFDKPLVMAGLRDIFKMRKRLEDDSIFNFIHRRFGRDVAEYVADPVIRGICGGDARQISAKFLMKSLFEYEQRYGSALLGVVLDRLRKKEADEKPTNVGYSNIALCSVREGWATWTLEGGLQLLPWAMEEHLMQHDNVEIKKDVVIKEVKVQADKPVEIKYSTDEETEENELLTSDSVISTIPCSELGKVLTNDHVELKETLANMPRTDIQVTNLMYKDKDILKHDAFGFLVPSSSGESVKGLLGIVFDTCSFPQDDKLVMTVMSKPGQDYANVLAYIRKTLGIERKPDDGYSEVLHNCIPQYTVGHYDRVDKIRAYLKGMPLQVAGASYDGISVNEAIFSGKTTAENINLE